jgi:hypothetical protein
MAMHMVTGEPFRREVLEALMDEMYKTGVLVRESVKYESAPLTMTVESAISPDDEAALLRLDGVITTTLPQTGYGPGKCPCDSCKAEFGEPERDLHVLPDNCVAYTCTDDFVGHYHEFDVANGSPCECGARLVAVPGMVGVYEIWGGPTSQPEPHPDPVGDFIARRIAKREAQAPMMDDEWLKDAQRSIAADETARKLGRAMSKLAPHDPTIHERVMPWRNPL